MNHGYKDNAFVYAVRVACTSINVCATYTHLSIGLVGVDQYVFITFIDLRLVRKLDGSHRVYSEFIPCACGLCVFSESG